MSGQLECNGVYSEASGGFGLFLILHFSWLWLGFGIKLVMTVDDDGHQLNPVMGKVCATRLNCGLWQQNKSYVNDKSLRNRQNEQHAPFQHFALRLQVRTSPSPGFPAEIILPTC